MYAYQSLVAELLFELAMAAPVAFSSQATGQGTCPKAMVGALSFLPVKTCQFKCNDMSIVKRQPCMRARAWNKPNTNRRPKIFMSSVRGSDIGSNSLSPSDTIKQFYTCINNKDLNQLHGFISDDCFFDDCSFFIPFQGKKEVMDFFGQLIDSMGQNIEFKIGLVCEGDDLIAGVTWHLEWNKKQIPFTRGSSFYECSMEGTRLVIKGAQVLTESPIKPGHPSLILLKIMTSLFNAFPRAAEWFLENPNVILQVVIRIYNMVLRPFIRPFLAWYIRYWKFMHQLLSSIFKILVFISKIFYK